MSTEQISETFFTMEVKHFNGKFDSEFWRNVGQMVNSACYVEFQGKTSITKTKHHFYTIFRGKPLSIIYETFGWGKWNMCNLQTTATNFQKK